jgi:uncharacterized membrane protein YphA (DoxX/SURF4 family)
VEMFAFGFNSLDFALFVNRVTLGLFFVLARFRFFYDPQRGGNLTAAPLPGGWTGEHDYNERVFFNPRRLANLTRKMCHCGWRKGAAFWAWFAAIVEVGAGLFLILGLLSALSALGLFAVTAAATVCTAREKVAKQHPVDKVDCVACYLWCAEPLYIVMALVTLAAGPGAWSLDSLLWS